MHIMGKFTGVWHANEMHRLLAVEALQPLQCVVADVVCVVVLWDPSVCCGCLRKPGHYARVKSLGTRVAHTNLQRVTLPAF
jgi:hypothetical protein